LSGRGLCDELITRPEESYRLCCIVVCDLETSRMGAPKIYDISRLRVNVNLFETSFDRFILITYCQKSSLLPSVLFQIVLIAAFLQFYFSFNCLPFSWNWDLLPPLATATKVISDPGNALLPRLTKYCSYDELAGVPGFARDEKLRKQIFEITWRKKVWIG